MIDTSMQQLVDHAVDRVPGVLGALVSTADGLVLSSRLTHETGLDAAAIGAMSAAVLGLSNRLVQLMGPAPASFSHQRSADGQVFVFGVSTAAVLTLLTDADAEAAQIRSIGRELIVGLEPLVHP
jgi:predicted regulator of Ras-like GTPase activity (Roadblock/LC7/MglB family)